MAVDPSAFPDVRNVVAARAGIARTRRENALQPGRLRLQGQKEKLNAFTLRQGERTEVRQTAGDDIMTRIQAGEAGAFQELATIDPARANTVLDGLAKQRKARREETDLALLATMRLAVAGAQSPQDWTRMRNRVLEQHPTLTPEDIPEKPSATFMKSAIAMGAGVQALQKQAGFGQGNAFVTTGVAGQPGATQNVLANQGTGRVVAKVGPPKTPAPKAAAGAGKGAVAGGVKTAASNAILKAVNQLHGGVFDAQGNLTVLDPELRNKVLNIAERAEVILGRGTVSGALQAVKQAAQEAGFDFAELGVTVRDQRSPTGRSVNQPGAGAADPKRIRDFLR